MASSSVMGGALVTSRIKVNGSTILDEYPVYSILVQKPVNRIEQALIVILDGDSAQENFKISSSDYFVPGKKISIEVGYDNENKEIFSGIITGQSLRVDDEAGSALHVVCQAEAVKMTVGRKNASFRDTTDSDAIKKIIDQSGLQAEVKATNQQMPVLQQYYCSDWDFIVTRAEVNGMLVKTVGNKVEVFSPTENTTPVLDIIYDNNLLSFNADLDSLTQFSEVKASAWDYKTQSLIDAQAKPAGAGVGNLSQNQLSEVVGLDDFQLQTSAPLASSNLTSWAKAQVSKSELSKIVGDMSFQGSSEVEPGSYISVGGMGDRFNGDHFVSSVTHSLSDGDWTTKTGIGLSADWFIQHHTVVAAPQASDLIPGIQGLYNAKVKQSNDDPESELRILIDLPLFDSSGDGIWARLSNFYSTNGAGAFFYLRWGMR